MSELSFNNFVGTLPEIVLPALPAVLRAAVVVHQPFRAIIQFHFGEKRLHYEMGRAYGRPGWELGLHCEARDKQLNRFLLLGFRRHLLEIKDTLGAQVEAEMWDCGWTKIYEVVADAPRTAAFQAQLGQRLAALMVGLHPIFIELRSEVSSVYR